jgi:hypothetical protein
MRGMFTLNLLVYEICVPDMVSGIINQVKGHIVPVTVPFLDGFIHLSLDRKRKLFS